MKNMKNKFIRYSIGVIVILVAGIFLARLFGPVRTVKEVVKEVRVGAIGDTSITGKLASVIIGNTVATTTYASLFNGDARDRFIIGVYLYMSTSSRSSQCSTCGLFTLLAATSSNQYNIWTNGGSITGAGANASNTNYIVQMDYSPSQGLFFASSSPGLTGRGGVGGVLAGYATTTSSTTLQTLMGGVGSSTSMRIWPPGTYINLIAPGTSSGSSIGDVTVNGVFGVEYIPSFGNATNSYQAF